jgi:hypothetical protein
MKFPINVSKNMEAASTASASEKTTALVIITVLANIFIFSYVSGFISGRFLPLIVIIQIIVTIILFVVILRVAVIREDDKMIEHVRSKDSSLSNYFFVRNKDNFEKIREATIFEYTDGNFALMMSFKFGATTDQKAEGNREIFNELFRTIGTHELEHRVYNMPENFRESLECKTFIKSLTAIEDTDLSRVMLDLTNHVLDICSQYNSLYDTIVIIRTRNPYQRQMFDIILNKLEEITKIDNSIRSIEFLNEDGMRAFMRDYHGLEALDLSSLKISEVSTDTLLSMKGLVNVRRVQYKDGTINELSKLKLETGSVKIND